MTDKAKTESDANSAQPSDDSVDPPLPGSKPLQIFLLAALVISGVAYVQDEWAQLTGSQRPVPGLTQLHRLVQAQSAFLDHTHQAQAALQRQDIDTAVEEYRLAVKWQDCAEGHESLGRALLLKRQFDAAYEQFLEGAKLEPSRMSLYLAWGEALQQQGKPQAAEIIYRQALDHNPNNGTLHYELAKALQARERNALGQLRLARATEDSPGAEKAQIEASRFGEEALQEYAKAGNGQDTSDFWCDYGTLLNEQANYRKAIPLLRRASSEDPRMPRAVEQLALAEERLGNYTEAAAAYKKALSLLPDDPQILNALALLYATADKPEARDPQQAVALASRACAEISSQNARFLDTLARAYAASGKLAAAIATEDKAIQCASELGDRQLRHDLEARRTEWAHQH